MDKKQTQRWSKSETELIKSTFGGEQGGELLLQIRDVLMQFGYEIPSLEKDVTKILRKLILPVLNKDLPIGFQADVVNALAGTPEHAGIKDMLPEMAIIHIQANDVVIEYLNQRLCVLEHKDYEGKCISLKDLKGKAGGDRLVNMMAYLFLENSYIEAGLTSLKTMANQKELTEEEKTKMAKENSSK